MSPLNEDTRQLVENEQRPDEEDAFMDNDVLVPAALPHARNNQHHHNNDANNDAFFHNVHLPETRVTAEPPDPYGFTYFVFYLLGIATMTPWNFFVTAEDYWMYKFRNTTNNDSTIVDELTPLQKSFTCDLTLTASVSGTTFLILNAIYGHKVSLKLKMLGTLSMILIIFVVTTAFVEVNTDGWQEQFFLITLFTVIIINTSSATMSGGIFGIAGLFPSAYMTALVSGQALGGIFTALAFIFVLAFDFDPKTTATIYFTIGSLVIILSIGSYVLMSRTKFFRYYVEEGGDKYEILCETPAHSRAVVESGVALEPNIREVFGKIYVDIVTICLLFATTLSVYPSVSTLMKSQYHGNGQPWNDIYYMPVVNYLFFNSGDYIGRIIAGFWNGPSHTPHTALLMTFLRVLYVPFILCSNTDLHQFMPILIHSDWAFMLLIITFGLTNGYLANVILTNAPRLVAQHEKEIASSIMAASLSCGLALGSVLSMAFVQML